MLRPAASTLSSSPCWRASGNFLLFRAFRIVRWRWACFRSETFLPRPSLCRQRNVPFLRFFITSFDIARYAPEYFRPISVPLAIYCPPCRNANSCRRVPDGTEDEGLPLRVPRGWSNEGISAVVRLPHALASLGGKRCSPVSCAKNSCRVVSARAVSCSGAGRLSEQANPVAGRLSAWRADRRVVAHAGTGSAQGPGSGDCCCYSPSPGNWRPCGDGGRDVAGRRLHHWRDAQFGHDTSAANFRIFGLTSRKHRRYRERGLGSGSASPSRLIATSRLSKDFIERARKEPGKTVARHSGNRHDDGCSVARCVSRKRS